MTVAGLHLQEKGWRFDPLKKSADPLTLYIKICKKGQLPFELPCY